MDSDVAKRLGVEATQGVVITSVRDGSPAADAGLAPGMVIVEVERQDVNTVSEFANDQSRAAANIPMTDSCCWSAPPRAHASSS